MLVNVITEPFSCGVCGEPIVICSTGDGAEFLLDYWDLASNHDVNPLDLLEHECVGFHYYEYEE